MIASARIERAELPVQRNRILYFSIASSAAGGAAGNFGKRRADGGIAVAAILHQERQQPGHALIIGGVYDGSPIAPRRNQPRISKQGEIGRERVGQHAELARDLARRQAAMPGPDQQPEDGKSALMRQGR